MFAYLPVYFIYKTPIYILFHQGIPVNPSLTHMYSAVGLKFALLKGRIAIAKRLQFRLSRKRSMCFKTPTKR